MNSSDVTVVGMAPYTVVLEDIQMDVPPQRSVTIPGDLASMSKDLARYISQRLLLQVNIVPAPIAPPRSAVSLELDRLRIVAAQLEAENKRLQAEVQRLERLLQDRPLTTDPRLEEILTLLRSQSGGGLAAGVVGGPILPVIPAVVEVEVPQYIPERISPEVVGGRVKISQETTEAPGVDEAKSALRKLRSQ